MRQRVAELVEEIEQQAIEKHRDEGFTALRGGSGETYPRGRKEVLKHHPHYRPNKVKKSPSPSFHAVRRSAYKELRAAYNWFETAYREAADRLRLGDRDVDFPEGSFPPRLPFVRPVLLLAPG